LKTTRTRGVSLLVLLAMLAAGLAVRAAAQDPIVVRPGADRPAPVTAGRFDHAAWDALLRRHVDAEGRVNYAEFKARDAGELLAYLQELAAADPAALADDAERLAYWINAYNALTVHGILQFHPTQSIRDHVSRLWGFHFWKDVRLEVSGSERSLDEIEHGILRRLNEPRIHFAIVCASVGCPKLLDRAYTGIGIAPPPTAAGAAPQPGQLQVAARAFFADPRHFRIDRERRTVHVSAILDWFKEDFGTTERERLDFIRRQLDSPQDREFLERRDLKLRFLDYDWSLNEQPAS